MHVKTASVTKQSDCRTAHLSQESVDKNGLDLAKAVNPEDTLDVVGRVPGSIKDNDPVSSHQVDTQRPGSGGDEEQTTPEGDGRESRAVNYKIYANLCIIRVSIYVLHIYRERPDQSTLQTRIAHRL